MPALRKIHGLLNSHRRFGHNYAQNTYHIRKLLRKDEADHDRELEYIKKTLTSDPCLQSLDITKDLTKMTDASVQGCGWVAYQRFSDDNLLHPISFGGWGLRQAEGRYWPFELEMLAAALDCANMSILLSEGVCY